MSNFHAKITHENEIENERGNYFLEDVGSTNRTWLRLSAEGQMSVQYKLEVCDIIKIGSTVFLVQQITRVSNSGNMPIINPSHRGILNDPDPISDQVSVSDDSVSQSGAELCKICFAKKSNIALIPCGHSTFCRECAMKFDNECPVCRTVITGKIKLYK